jgi:transcriptional antiterminator RfaH
VDDPLVDMLCSRELAQPTKPLFNQGDTVVITEGPFAGLEAAYRMADAEQRVMVLLHILSQPVPVQIDAARLRKVS